jgi:hypothetical protein
MQQLENTSYKRTRHEDDEEQKEAQLITPLASVENRMVLRKRLKSN